MASGSGVATGSSGGDQGSRDLGSLFRSPSDVATGVVEGSFWFAPIGFGLPGVNTGGEGRPSQPHSRNATTSWKKKKN
jgi:hypothetical protein